MDASDDDASPTLGRLRWRWVALLLLIGIILAGATLFVIWRVALQPPAADEYSPARPPVPVSAAYYETVEEQIAQGLGETVAQVKAGIAAEPNEGLFGVTTARGVAPEQLYSIEIAALQAASNQMVAAGVWTQPQADSTMRYWRERGAKALGSDMTSWFLQH